MFSYEKSNAYRKGIKYPTAAAGVLAKQKSLQ